MTEAEGRQALLDTGKKWINTPYTNQGAICQAGANCAMLVYGIARDAGVIPPSAPAPRWYSPQLHVHSREERLLANIKACGGVEIEEQDVKPGDVVAYLSGESHGHLALIYEWPRKVLHATEARGTQFAHGKGGRQGGCAMKFFSIWPRKPVSSPEETERATDLVRQSEQ